MSKLALNDVNIYYGDFHAVQNVNMQIPAQAVTAFIGPSGCGKSTVLRTINRMHEVIPGASVKGEILLDGTNIYGPKVCLLYTSPSPRDRTRSRMPSSA